MQTSSGEAGFEQFKLLLSSASTAMNGSDTDNAQAAADTLNSAEGSAEQQSRIDENQAQIKELKEELTRLSEDYGEL